MTVCLLIEVTKPVKPAMGRPPPLPAVSYHKLYFNALQVLPCCARQFRPPMHCNGEQICQHNMAMPRRGGRSKVWLAPGCCMAAQRGLRR